MKARIQRILRPETDQDKQQQQIIILLLIAGIGFHYFIYLPQEETRKLERQIQEIISQVANSPPPQDYSSLLTTCRSYLRWKDGTAEQQTALENQKEQLEEAIQWLIEAEKRMADENAQTRTQKEEAKKQKELEMIKKKKLHWRRQRNRRSWTEDWIARRKDSFEKVLADLGGEENINVFNTAGDYTIHFPPSVWSNLNEKQRELAEKNGHGELKLDDKTRNFRYNQLIEDWEEQVTYNPVRGEPDPRTEKDNNALFYGTGGTGKTSLVRRIAYNSDYYPLIEIKGSNLSPRKEDYDNGIDALNKFIFTLCDIENTLEDDYGFSRDATNSEVRYILFVDEADNVHKIAAISDHTRLIFLKACMEGISKDSQSKNLWIFATNYLNLIDPPVYRPGRLSNPLDFSWTLGDFKHYCEKKGITSQFPLHWHETDTLNDEDNKWVNRFNTMSFESEFLPFWRKFIVHPETLEQLPEIKKEDATEENPAKPGIKIGEMLEFFWNLFDSKQLAHFTGKYERPRKPTTEEVLSTVTDAVDTCLKELTEQSIQLKEEMIRQKNEYIGEISQNFTKVSIILGEICKNFQN